MVGMVPSWSKPQVSMPSGSISVKPHLVGFGVQQVLGIQTGFDTLGQIDFLFRIQQAHLHNELNNWGEQLDQMNIKEHIFLIRSNRDINH